MCETESVQGTMTEDSRRFEVSAETQLGEEIELGKAEEVGGICEIIESVDESKYDPVEYRVRPMEEEDEPHDGPEAGDRRE